MFLQALVLTIALPLHPPNKPPGPNTGSKNGMIIAKNTADNGA